MLLTVVINRNDKILNRNAVNIFRFDTTHFITSTPTDEKSNIIGAYNFFFHFFTFKSKISLTFTSDREKIFIYIDKHGFVDKMVSNNYIIIILGLMISQ